MAAGLGRLEELAAQDYDSIRIGAADYSMDRAREDLGDKEISVRVPAAIADMMPHLQNFVEGMVAKLYDNKHKTPPRQCDALKFLMLMHREMVELHEQCIEDRSSPNLHQETYDVANYAFLMGMAMVLERQDKLAQEMRAEDEKERAWWRGLAPNLKKKLRDLLETVKDKGR